MALSYLLPLVAVIVLLFLGAVFTFYESVYLQDQAMEIGRNASKIVLWMWVFRIVCLAFASLAFLLLVFAARRYMNPG